MSSQYEWLYDKEAEEIAYTRYGCQFSELNPTLQADLYQEAMQRVAEASA
jgi:hypothetical protein